MAVGKHAQWTKRDRSNENFKKKWSTLKKNGLNIHQSYDAELYVCIRRRGEKYEFKSTEKAFNESFPPPVLVTAVDVADERSDQKNSTWGKGWRRGNDQEGALCVGSPSTGLERSSPIDIEDT
ncbi:hypothetical protein IWW34DRAFT_810256 [Fusarium oxysporum f. sp. albedinis]|nr:hypothetical protein IWW34DRAFT_810256 [Fusarium oxysporum f. sp. albedinis]